MGALFLADVWGQPSKITPELYGPVVYAIPAIFWAGAQAFGGYLGAVGAAYGNKAGAIAAFASSLWLFVTFSMLSFFAMEASQGTIVVAGTRGMLLPMCFLVMVSSLERLTK